MNKWIFVFLLIAASCAFSQDFAVDKGSTILMGKLGMENYYLYTGEYDIENTTEKFTQITVAPRIHQFFAARFALGAEMRLSRTSQKISTAGATDKDEASSYSMSIGPSFGYYFGQPATGVYPYLMAGIMYCTSGTSEPIGNRSGNDSDSIEGRDISVGAGFIASLREHFGLVVEVSYHSLDMSETYNLSKMFSTPEDGNVLEISVGVAGLFF